MVNGLIILVLVVVVLSYPAEWAYKRWKNRSGSFWPPTPAPQPEPATPVISRDDALSRIEYLRDWCIKANEPKVREHIDAAGRELYSGGSDGK